MKFNGYISLNLMKFLWPRDECLNISGSYFCIFQQNDDILLIIFINLQVKSTFFPVFLEDYCWFLGFTVCYGERLRSKGRKMRLGLQIPHKNHTLQQRMKDHREPLPINCMLRILAHGFDCSLQGQS